MDDKNRLERTTEQVQPHNPTGKGGFADNPQNRNPGGWNKEHSISYQYNRLMRMTPEEVETFKPETMAQKIALQRIKAAADNDGLPDTKEITDRTEGKAPQFIGIGDVDDYDKVALVEFLDGKDPAEEDQSTDTN